MPSVYSTERSRGRGLGAPEDMGCADESEAEGGRAQRLAGSQVVSSRGAWVHPQAPDSLLTAFLRTRPPRHPVAGLQQPELAWTLPPPWSTTPPSSSSGREGLWDEGKWRGGGTPGQAGCCSPCVSSLVSAGSLWSPGTVGRACSETAKSRRYRQVLL